MSKHISSVPAIALAFFLLFSVLAGATAAASEPAPLDRIVLEQGTSSAFGGSRYVAVNMTRGDNAAWFGVLYGTEDSPAPITLVGACVRYLGGAEVRDENGGMMVPAVPIPIVTVFAQSLCAMIEFNDTGYAYDGGRAGGGNGLFDFVGNRSVSGMTFLTMEPVYKLVNLTRDWHLSEIEEKVDVQNSTKTYEFSLTAEEVSYDKIWDGKPAEMPDGSRAGTSEDGAVEIIRFTFHVEATAEEMTAEVPWYRVTISQDNTIISSEPAGTKTYTGVGVGAAFKYDHLIEGWDYTAKSETSKLMLENLLFFGTFIPDKVQEWLDSQFVRGESDAAGVAEYETSDGLRSANDTAELPMASQKVSKNWIVFRDNWEKCGSLTWVSDVVVDGEAEEMYYQVHAGSRQDFRAENDDGEVKTIAVIGGYICPAGADIYHDPTFETSAFVISMPDIESTLGLALIAMSVVCGGSLAGLVLIRGRSRNGKNRNQAPPGYRKL